MRLFCGNMAKFLKKRNIREKVLTGVVAGLAILTLAGIDRFLDYEPREVVSEIKVAEIKEESPERQIYIENVSINLPQYDGQRSTQRVMSSGLIKDSYTISELIEYLEQGISTRGRPALSWDEHMDDTNNMRVNGEDIGSRQERSGRTVGDGDWVKPAFDLVESLR